MEIRKIDENHRTTRFLLKGMDASFVNAIRRTIMETVPTIAVETVSIYKNNSAMFDEFLSHRLGMITLKTDAKGYKMGETVKLVLEKDGPGTVYSKDIKSTDPKIEVVDKNIPVVKLRKDQSVKLEMEAVMNVGREHAKWQPAIIGYQQLPMVKQKKDMDAKMQKAVVDVCPTDVLEVKAGKVVLKDPLDCILCGACRDISKDAMDVGVEENSFIFSIETTGSLATKEIFEHAIAALKEKTGAFEGELKKLSA